ncbi:MAG: uroporphyrinogen decarboxylase family protein, partial [Clostridia bacterium]
DPNAPERTRAMEAYMPGIVAQARRGCVVEQYMVGGYMYLRSLMGPEGLLYMFYDDPELIEECMKAWFTLADTMIARHQQQVSLDEILLDEDICYKQGSLISPEMIRKFLLPYYEQLIQNARRRQLDSKRPIQYHVGSDGHFDAVIPLYQQTGMNFLSPFEVAADSDVVRTGREYPELLISGGMDKREMSRGHDAIDRMIDRILPVMQARGGYFPTCDHGVPEEVSLENYMYYRTRCQAF